MTQVVSTGTQTLGSFLPVLWKLPSTEYLEDLSEEFMIFEQGNIERDVVNQDPDSQIIISSYYKPVKVKKLTQYKSGQKGVKCEIAVESVIKLNTTRKQTKNKGSLCSSRTSQDSQPETSLGTRREVSTHIGSTLDENNHGNHTRMEEDYSNENEKEGDSINKTEIKDTYRKVSSGGTVLSSGTMSLNETVLLGTNKNVAETKESGDHKTGGIDSLGGNNKNTSVMPAEGHYDEVDISGRFKNHTMVMMLHNYCKKSVAKTEKINVNNATAYYVDRKKPEGLKHTKTYKYQKGYRKVEIAGCLNLSYAIKDGFILASRRNSQGQNSELTTAENSDIIDKGEPQKDDMSTQLLKNNIPDGTENGDEQGVPGFVNEGNYEGVCKGDNNDTANLTRGDNLDNNKPIISDTQTQESQTSEHEHPLRCSFCNKSFKDRSYFYVHKWSHIAKSQNLRIKCSVCSREFNTIPRMNSHFKISHSDIKPYLCNFCGKRFSNRRHFYRHSNTYTQKCTKVKESIDVNATASDADTGPYLCHFCGKMFIHKRSFKRHSNTCSHKYTKEKESIDVNNATTSDVDIRPYLCNFCDKSFNYKGNFYRHCNTCSHKYTKEKESIDVNNATASDVDREIPEGLKHIKTYKYKKGYRIVDLASCLNLSYAIKDGFILASRRNSQGQNSELTMAENSDIIVKGEPQKDDMSTQLLKNNIPDGTENGDGQGVSGFVNEGNYEGVCKGDNNDTANLTRGDNLDNNKPIISDTQTQESHTSEHEHPSKCKFCNKWFKDRSYFYVHKWSHIAKSQNLRFKCSICSREFKTIPRMNSHFKVSHSDIKPYLCKFCGKSFSHKGSFDCHTNTHTKDIKYSCKYCNQNFTEKSKLNNHLKKCPLGEETSDQSQTIKCNCCNKSFVNENNLQKHKNSMNKQMNEHHVCPKCGKEFKTLGRVNAHVRVVHPKVKAFQCYKCGKCFATNHILNAHLRNHLNSISKPYLCSFCPKRFAQSHSCKQHETIHKKSDSSFGTYQEKKLCTICHKWIVKSFFNQHLLKHMGLQLKTHVCTICNKQFANKHNLMVHNRIHSRVKPFSCEHCNMSFITKSSLVRHLRWHAGFKRESKFPCEICGKTFTYNYKRKRHQAKHAEYAAFECVYCRVKFHTHDDLHTHLISSEQCSSDLYTNVTMATNCSNVQVKIVGKECQVTKVTDSTN